MSKIALELTFFGAVIISFCVGILFCKFFYKEMIEEREEDRQLQNIAFTHQVLIHLDNGDIDSAREEVLTKFNSLVYTSEPLKFYSTKYAEACGLYKIIYKYRRSKSEEYISKNSIDQNVESIIDAWSAVDCKN